MSIINSEQNKVNILGLNISKITIDGLHRIIYNYIKNNDKKYILYVNVHAVNLSYKYLWFKNFLNTSDILFCDGDGVRLASKLIKNEIPQKITYDRWLWQLSQYCIENDFSMYFLGSKEGVALKAKQNILKKYTKLNITGCHHGYFNKNNDENKDIIKKINLLRPNILIVGMGMPIQEKWVMNNINDLDVNVVLTGGACFDYVAGFAKRAPKWMLNINLEWFYRFINEPKRLFKRYIIGNPLFFWRIFYTYHFKNNHF